MNIHFAVFNFIVWVIFILGFLLGLFNKVFAQEITEEDKVSQEQVLREDPRNFSANFIVGAFYYNRAIEPHQKTVQMQLNQYLSEGQSYEAEKNEFLRQSLPYFENAYLIRPDDPQVRQVLKLIYQHLGMIAREPRANPEEIESQFQEKLDTLEFQELK